MSELQTSDAQKLAEFMRLNNLEVLNNTQISAILMKQEELLKQVLAFASDNIEALEKRIRFLELWASNN